MSYVHDRKTSWLSRKKRLESSSTWDPKSIHGSGSQEREKA